MPDLTPTGSDGAPPDSSALLTVRGLRVRADGNPPTELVRGVDLTVQREQVVALLGESACGKSLTARAIIGVTPDNMTVTADELRLGDLDLMGLTADQRRRIRGKRIGLVMQDALSALNPVRSVGAHLAELLHAHTDMNRRQIAERCRDLLGVVGIPDPARRLKEYPHQFSGGMRQRILIAMAIALNPELLIADEPTTALDVTVQAQILELLDDLRRQFRMGVLLITHDFGVVCEVADHVVVMYAGRVAENASGDEIFGRPAHPYSVALLQAIPQAHHRGSDLYAIPGSPPSPVRLPSGCAFHPRCPLAVERCRQEIPALGPVLPGHLAACHRAEEVLHGLR